MVGLYIHLPFCLQRCPYCNYSTRIYREERVGPFIEDLTREIDLLREEYGPLSLESIYLGGGTPSLLSSTHLHSLFSSLKTSFDLSGVKETTCEINPKGIKREYLMGLKELGIDRLSIGIQSFSPPILSLLGRGHSPTEGEETYYLAREAGFERINLDLIFAVPGQKIGDWEENLKRVLLLSPEHLSLYHLQLEEGTLFNRWVKEGRLKMPEEELDYEMYVMGISYLKENNYQHYEISNFAQPGGESLHNLLYWRSRDYIGLGPGASGYYGGERYRNTASLKDYKKTLEKRDRPLEYRHSLSMKERLEETMFMGLRLLEEGIHCREVEEILGIDPLHVYREEIEDLMNKELIYCNGETLTLTRRGLMMANQVMAFFIKE